VSESKSNVTKTISRVSADVEFYGVEEGVKKMKRMEKKGGGLSQSEKELKKLLGTNNGRNELDSEQKDDNDDDDDVRIYQKSQENSQKRASTDTRIRRVQKSDQKPEAKPEKLSPQSNPVNNGQQKSTTTRQNLTTIQF
ncbi:hypothetical protein Tco_0832902, partial [Tanacetum coccineum]